MARPHYGFVYSVMAGLDPAMHQLRKKHLAKGMDPRVKPGGGACGDHFTGATATAMVQTSLPRLMISRLSFGPM
jgi:hypothetical protein